MTTTVPIHPLPEILLLTHGGWGLQLCNSLRMVMGEIEGVCNQVNHLIPTRVLVKGGEITCKILK